MKHDITWVSFFELFPSLRVDSGGVPLSVLLDVIPPQHPRYYSVASSHDLTPHEFTLVVGQHSTVVPGNAKVDSWYHGICSSYIRSLQLGDEVDFHMIPVKSFRLPISYSAPVVCISTGTGFAPIYGFVQQRLYRMRESISTGIQMGEFVIIHGARDESERPFAEELEEALALGAITAIHYALSRSTSAPKQYVQDLILSPPIAGQLRAILTKSEKSSVYVCGNTNMARCVREALSSEIIFPPNLLRIMCDRGSYHEEVF